MNNEMMWVFIKDIFGNGGFKSFLPRVPCSPSRAGGMPASMGWAFYLQRGDMGFMAGGRCMGGSADGVAGGRTNPGESCSLKALHFEKYEHG